MQVFSRFFSKKVQFFVKCMKNPAIGSRMKKKNYECGILGMNGWRRRKV